MSHAAKHPNYAIWRTTRGHVLFGGNVERPHEIKVAIDPDDVMVLTCGQKF